MPKPVNPRFSRNYLVLVGFMLLAVGFGVYYAFPPLGLTVLISTVIAAAWTVVVSFRRGREGRNMDPGEKFGVFASTLGSAFAIVCASSIAFIATCFPIGLFGTNFEGGQGSAISPWVPWVAGGVAALVAGGVTACYLDRKSRGGDDEIPLKKRKW